MKLANPEALAQDLEDGLGELGWHYDMIPGEHRLHLPVSAISSLAIASALREAGHRVRVVQTRSLSASRDETHVFPIVAPNSLSPTIIDTTYGSLLRLAGLTPEGILNGQEDDYPIDKILTFKQGNTDLPAHTLTMKAVQALENWQPRPQTPPFEPPLKDMGASAIYLTYSEFWHPRNFQDFTPSPLVLGEAEYLRGSILNTSVAMEEY